MSGVFLVISFIESGFKN